MTTCASTTTEQFGFFRAWLSDPLRVAAVMPSGAALARLITSEIEPAHGPVLELGPGTGVFTLALLERGLAQEELALVECGSEFAERLARRFPQEALLQMDAAKLKRVPLFEGRPLGAVVSGLPLLSMPPRKVLAILDTAFCRLRPGGAFYQFTYGFTCPVSRVMLDRLGLKAVSIGRAWTNVPPASVYRITRRCPRLPRPGTSRAGA